MNSPLKAVDPRDSEAFHKSNDEKRPVGSVVVHEGQNVLTPSERKEIIALLEKLYLY